MITLGTRENINAIRDIEREVQQDTSLVERLGAAAARIITHPMIMLPHAIGIIAWIVFNANSRLGINPIDPYPFPILGLALSLEALVLAVVLLVNQRYQTRVQEHLEHLNLQITLLAEQESTK